MSRLFLRFSRNWLRGVECASGLERTAGDIKDFNRGEAMGTSPRGAYRRFIINVVVAWFTIGFLAMLWVVISAWWWHDAELMRTTADVEPLIRRIYRYRRDHSDYPLSLGELRPIVGDVVERHSANDPVEDDDFCAFLVLDLPLQARCDSCNAPEVCRRPWISRLHVCPVQAAKHCHRALENQPFMGASKPATPCG